MWKPRFNIWKIETDPLSFSHPGFMWVNIRDGNDDPLDQINYIHSIGIRFEGFGYYIQFILDKKRRWNN